jgi:hypothetical protein
VRQKSDSGVAHPGDDRTSKEVDSSYFLDLKRLASNSQGERGDGAESSCREGVTVSGGWAGWGVAGRRVAATETSGVRSVAW